MAPRRLPLRQRPHHRRPQGTRRSHSQTTRPESLTREAVSPSTRCSTQWLACGAGSRRPCRVCRMQSPRDRSLPASSRKRSRPSTRLVKRASLDWRSTCRSTLRVRLGAAAAPLCARWLPAHLIAAGGEIRGHPATEGRLGVVVVLRVKPAANQLSSDAVRQI